MAESQFTGEFRMKLETNSDLEMSFKIPTEEDFKCNRREYRPFSFRKYLDFISLGIKMCSDNNQTYKHDIKNAPKVRFEL